MAEKKTRAEARYQGNRALFNHLIGGWKRKTRPERQSRTPIENRPALTPPIPYFGFSYGVAGCLRWVVKLRNLGTSRYFRSWAKNSTVAVWLGLVQAEGGAFFHIQYSANALDERPACA
jgi:hypothetical protein